MALALEWMRMMPILPYKLDRMMDLGFLVLTAVREARKCCVLQLPMLHMSSRLNECNATLVQSTWRHIWSNNNWSKGHHSRHSSLNDIWSLLE